MADGDDPAATTSQAAPARAVLRTVMLSIALMIGFPVFTHAAVLLDAPRWQWLALCDIAAIPLAAGLAAPRAKAWLLLASMAAALYALTTAGGGRFALYLPSLVLTGGLAAIFAGTLLPGREPLTLVFARLHRGGKVPAELQVYCRRLTAFWALFLGAVCAVNLLLAALAPPWLWSSFANGFSYLLILAVFVGEFFLRRLWFPDAEHDGFVAYLRFMTRIRLGQVR